MASLSQNTLERNDRLLRHIRQTVDEIKNEITAFNAFQKSIRWAAIFVGGLANLTYSGYYAVVNVLESEGMWSIRLWMATQEWWWFILAVLVLAISLGLDIWAFLLGEGVDATILLLSFELGIAINTVLIQALRLRHFRELLYDCWSGRSRTARPRSQEWLRDIHEVAWHEALADSNATLIRLPTESRLNPHNVVSARDKILYDLTEAMNQISRSLHGQRRDRDPQDDSNVGKSGYLQVYVYHTDTDMSVAWGGNSSFLFQKRVSRGIMAIKVSQIVNALSLTVSDTDRWKIASDGILARNKGLQPWRLVCKRTTVPDNPAETSSPLYPRASKTLRSTVAEAIREQYHGLGGDFVEAGVELNLLMRDVNSSDLSRWLQNECEQQDFHADWQLWNDSRNEKLLELSYLLQYVGMLVSLHFMPLLDFERADEFVLLVATKLLLEQSQIDLGISLADLQRLTNNGQITISSARRQAVLLGVPGLRIVSAYLGLWVSERTAEKYISWIQDAMMLSWNEVLQQVS